MLTCICIDYSNFFFLHQYKSTSQSKIKEVWDENKKTISVFSDYILPKSTAAVDSPKVSLELNTDPRIHLWSILLGF